LKPVLKSRRGISEAITAMLLMGVAIAAAAVFVLYFNTTASRVSQASGSLPVVASGVKVYSGGSLSRVIFTLQVSNNLGNPVTINTVQVQEITSSGSPVTCTLTPSSMTLSPGATASLSASCSASGGPDLPAYTLTITYTNTNNNQQGTVTVKAPASG